MLATPKEHQVKAVFLNGFSKFITWPEKLFTTPEQAFHICVFGENPFQKALDLAVAHEKWNGRSVQIDYIQQQQQIPHCQILYISASESIRLEAILATASLHPVLTVSDLDNFVKQGGMIQFYLRKNRIRFFIEPTSMREVGLRANANLLRVADIVEHGKPSNED